MIKNDFHKKIAGYLFYYLVALLLLRVTGGAFAVVVAAMGIAFALSYLKLVNFIVFFCGIWLGCACLKGSPAAIQTVRAELNGRCMS